MQCDQPDPPYPRQERDCPTDHVRAALLPCGTPTAPVLYPKVAPSGPCPCNVRCFCCLGASWCSWSSTRLTYQSHPKISPGDRGDVATYEAIVSRSRSGAHYYVVVGSELRSRHYATREAFNWRTPLLWSGLAAVPKAVSDGLLTGLGVALLVVTILLTARAPLWVAASTIMQTGALVPVLVAEVTVMGEIWAGVLIGLSVCMYAQKRPQAGVAFALLALFVRELAAPFCVAAARGRVQSTVEGSQRLGGWCMYVRRLLRAAP